MCAGAFAQTLRRYTSLNHLAQAARAVLQNTAQITQMLSDLNRVDFTNVQVTQLALFMSCHPQISLQFLIYKCVCVCVCVCVCEFRSRPHGCVAVKMVWSSRWSRTLNSPCSIRTLWSSGPHGWMGLSRRSWSRTPAARPSPKRPNSSCSNGASTGESPAYSPLHTAY